MSEATSRTQGKDTYTAPAHGWTCFHCGETFPPHGIHVIRAREHFGTTPDYQPGCVLKLNAEDRVLLTKLRSVEAELDRYREEDTDLHRALAAKSSEMAVAVRRAEEQGYARGLEDAKRYPETIGLMRAEV